MRQGNTNTTWPLIIFHACGDLTTVVAALSDHGILLSPTIGILLYVAGVLPMLALGAYGLFLLCPRQEPQATPTEPLAEIVERIGTADDRDGGRSWALDRDPRA